MTVGIIKNSQRNVKVKVKSNSRLFTALALSNDAQMGADGVVIGDPTEMRSMTRRNSVLIKRT
jgi:hypothetical protein